MKFRLIPLGLPWWMVALVVLGLVGQAALIVALVYVGLHFVQKYW